MIDESESDRSNGYDAIADEFLIARGARSIGDPEVRSWAQQLPSPATVLDLGCGNGIPVSQTLVENGIEVFGVNASPRMVSEYRKRFPQSTVACEAVEDSTFFDRTFDGIVAWGLIFLLPADAQIALIHKMGAAVKGGGRLLFTSPRQPCSWHDLKTGRLSISLGADVYRARLRSAGLSVVRELEDEGGNYYYESVRE